MKNRTMKFPVLLLCATVLLAIPNVGRSDDLSVHIDFPGGSALVESIDQEERSIRLMPSEHPKRGFRCWWYFRLEGLSEGETLTLNVGDAPWATPDQATVSVDGRETWQHTDHGRRKDKRITYQYRAKGDGPHWFAWGPPFVLTDAKRLVQEASKKGGDWATPFILTKSRDGHEVPSVRICEGENPPIGIWVHARQHAWESGSSWVCRGFLEWLVSSEGAALRKQAEVVITPIMDVDNVELGAGGKDQYPWDHNRDWRKKPHWPEVAAAQKEIASLHQDGRFHLYVDLHNPGADSNDTYFYITPRDLLSDKGVDNLDAFATNVRKFVTGPIPFRGRLSESGPKYSPGNWQYISKNWVSGLTHDSGAVAVTIETPWNTPGSHTVGYRTVGRQLGYAIERYVGKLKDRKKEEENAESQSLHEGSATTKRIQIAVQKEIDADLFPGAVVLVGKPGKVLYHEAFGYARITPEKAKMRKDSIFGLASVTKVVATGTAFGICVDDGLLSFDQPIRKALPGLSGDGIDDITVRQLATHTSGFTNTKYHQRVQGDAMLRLMLTASPKWEPGSHYQYSCLNMILMGLAVERATGKRLDVFCQERIFKPLGMTDTAFGPLKPSDRIVPSGNSSIGSVEDGQAREARRPVGNAGLFSTAADLASFCDMMLGKGQRDEVSVLSQATHAQMTRNLLPDSMPDHAFCWDMNLESTHRPSAISKQSYGHSGHTGQSVWIDPVKDVYVIVLTNRNHPKFVSGQRKLEQYRARGRIGDAALGALGY